MTTSFRISSYKYSDFYRASSHPYRELFIRTFVCDYYFAAFFDALCSNGKFEHKCKGNTKCSSFKYLNVRIINWKIIGNLICRGSHVCWKKIWGRGRKIESEVTFFIFLINK